MKLKLLLANLLIIVCAISTNVFSQDIIVLKTGDEIKAIVSEVDIQFIKYKKFENLTGPVYTLEKSKIFMIKYENGTKDVFGEQSEQKKETPVATDVTIKQDNNQVIKPLVYGSVTDIDGNVYKTITIGTQEWMAENLKTTRYRNGELIPNITDSKWSSQKKGAMCYYENNSANAVEYGCIYNWYAITDLQNICPEGWHIPTEAEWSVLISFLGGENVAGGKIKESGTSHWLAPNEGATNESGFTALPGGGRYDNGNFALKGLFGLWSTSAENDVSRVWYRTLDWNSSKIVNHHDGSKNGGGSIRCIRDKQ